MLSQAMRASRLSAVRAVRQQASSSRAFATSSFRQADIIQDLYIKELRAYKTPATKASDAEGSVQKFSVPKPPPSPEEADLASQLKEYEGQVVEVEGQSSETASADGAAVSETNWFEEKENFDEPEEHH